MDVSQVFILLGIGLLAGIVAGSLGIGGGIIIVPAFMFILGFTQLQAQGTSLAMMVPPAGLLAAYSYYKEGYINIKVALIVFVAFFIGGYIGSQISFNLSGKVLRKIFGVLMIIAAIKMIFGK